MTKFTKQQVILALLRITLGLIFLWAFFDKVLGLGFATTADKSWLLGNSPTLGFLKLGTKGPLAVFYQSIAGNPVVDWLFMLGLLGIGLALILGMGIKIASYSGTLLMILMWSAALPPKNHPFLDEHIVYALALISMNYVKAGHYFGLGKWWSSTKLVKKHPILE